jgi:ubiquinone/menaquinone biosynthesis C-methylase UbiE
MNTQDLAHDLDDEQTRLWNGPAGRAWVDGQAILDQMLQPFEDLLIEAVAARRPRRLLDVGCGTGSTTLAFAWLLGAQGECVGIDVSEPMIVAARERAETEHSRARFVRANAQLHEFEPATFDMFVSRFGVMFFDDPVRAFANFRRAATHDATLRFIAWRSPAENPFMTTAERAAAPLLPNLPPRKLDAPGQFAFADRERVSRILEESGWSDIDIRPTDVACSLPAKALDAYLDRMGPVGMALQDADEQTRTRVIATVRAAFDPYVHGAEVRYTAACWMVSARA